MTGTMRVRKPRLNPCILLGAMSTALAFDALSSAAAQDFLHRLWDNLAARPSGPMHFRFLLQPLMASIIAVRDGMDDARTGRTPYFWSITHDPAARRASLRQGLAATSRILALALVLDAVYQLKELDDFYPLEALIVALFLAFVPYLVVRGPAARVACWWKARGSPGARS